MYGLTSTHNRSFRGRVVFPGNQTIMYNISLHSQYVLEAEISVVIFVFI